MKPSIGIDFGTTNSVISVCDADGKTRTARFKWSTGESQTFRSVLCFWQEGRTLHHACAQNAIDEYLKDTEESRLIQSIKTYLGSSIFTDTRIFGVRFELEDLIALLLRDLWQRAAALLNLNPDPSTYHVVSGRPVKFAGFEPDENLAIKRLAESYTRAGFGSVEFAYEPEGAAFWFARQNITSGARVLVADFGGGTSDFSIVEINNGRIAPIAHSGIGIAGDVLDFRLIDNVVAPLLGKGSQYESFGKMLDMPIGYYRSFSSWHLLSMIKTPKTIREIQDILRTSSDPDAVSRLLIMIEKEMGYLLYASIAATKTALSKNDTSNFKFDAGDIHLNATVKRSDFNRWITSDLNAIRSTIEKLLTDTDLKAQQIDRVFMTGGTSFVPAIQDLMSDLFGKEKLAAGDEFTSVSAGLSLIARERVTKGQA